jgi:NAD(P)-dependent dehydrogenase (short-subunit alcohol dehydrogenase family)
MDMKLNGHTGALIQQALRNRMADAFAGAGDEGQLAITDRDGNALRKAQARLGNAERVHLLQGDLSTVDGAAAAVAGVEALGALDILVNNVGFFEVRNFFDTDDAAWASMFALNVMSGVRLARAVLPAMLACRRHPQGRRASSSFCSPWPSGRGSAWSRCARTIPG